MSFLAIPSQEGLVWKTMKGGRAAEEGNSDDEDDDAEEVFEEGDVRLIPRSSPVPRKRGASIYDETIEYMRIHQAGLIKRSVAFADTAGGDLVEVKEFYQFDSDDEDADAKWEKEEARYRKLQKEPIYNVQPEFVAKSGADLEEAVMKNKVEVELLSPAEDEPLAFTGIVRVLNVSFNKAVYIRSTMDNWASYFDYPADYVQGSHEADTDKFSFKMSFAPPYNTHGSRIEFVVRYETSDGDYWANNSQCNYVVTLLLSYEDDSAQDKSDLREIRGIMRPPKDYSAVDFNFEINNRNGDDEEHPGPSRSDDFRSNPICPIMPPPEIDIETHTSSSPRLPHHPEPPSVDGTPSITTVSSGEQKSPCVSSETTSHPYDDELSIIYQASEPIQPTESGHLHKTQSEFVNETSEQLKDTHLCTSLPASTSDPAHPHECSTHSATEEQIGLSTLSNPQPDIVTNPSVTEIPAHTRLDQNTAEWSLFPSSSEDVKLEAEHVSMETIESLKQVVKDPVTEDGPQLSIITHGPPDSTLHSSEDHSESDLGECKTEDSLQTDMFQPPQERMLDVDVESDAQFLSTEDSGPQTESMEALDISLALGDTLLPSAADTLPTATVTLDERSPCASSTTTLPTTDEEPSTVTQSRKPTETPEPSLTSEVSKVLESDEQYEGLQPEDVMNLESDEEQYLSPVQFKKPPTVPGCISDVPPFLHEVSVGMDEAALRHRAAWHEEKTPSAIFSPAVESEVPLASEAEREKEDSLPDSPEILPENLPITMSEAAKPSRNWIPPIVFLGSAGLLAVLFFTVFLH